MDAQGGCSGLVMSLAVLCLGVIGILSFVFLGRVSNPGKILALVGIALLFVFLFRPVCVPINERSSEDFNSSMARRSERMFYGVKVFQKRNGQWYQCKTWISRFVFF